MKPSNVTLALRVVAGLFTLAVVGHWIDVPWVSKVAAVGLAGVLVTAGLWAAWKGLDVDHDPGLVQLPPEPGPPVYQTDWPGCCNNDRPPPEPEPRTYRLDPTRTFHGPGS